MEGRVRDTLNFLENFQYNSLIEYKKLIIEFDDFSNCISQFNEEEKNIILQAFCNVFERIRENLYEQDDSNNNISSFLSEDFIDIREEKTYIAYKINKHFNELKKETQILLPLRLLLPENRYCHPNLELEDFKRERENR